MVVNRAPCGARRAVRDLSVRGKLLALVLLPLLVVLPLLGAILLLWGDQAIDRMLITKVRSDLAVAQGYFERVLGELHGSAVAIADSHALHLALAGSRQPGRCVPMRWCRCCRPTSCATSSTSSTCAAPTAS